MLLPETRLSLFQELIHSAIGVSLWTYDTDYSLIRTSSPTPQNGHFIALEDILASAVRFGETHQTPLVLSNSLGLVWISDYEYVDQALRYIHVIGPVQFESVSVQKMDSMLTHLQLSVKTKREFLQLMQSLPVISMTNFLQYGLMLHFCIYGESISIYDFQYHTPAPSCPQSESTSEEVTFHGTWELEKLITTLVEEGNLNYRSILNNVTLQANVGKVSVGDAVRQLKNTILASVVIVSRAAMRGGLYPELAYTLSDKYNQDVELCTSLSELGNVHMLMMDDFIKRVHAHKTSQSQPGLVRTCREYIELHIAEEIRIENIAAEFGYTPYYFSRKFKEESGMDLRIFIRDIRLEHARLLLMNPTLTIRQISEQLHFCSPSYFSEYFRQKYNISPTQFRADL